MLFIRPAIASLKTSRPSLMDQEKCLGGPHNAKLPGIGLDSGATCGFPLVVTNSQLSLDVINMPRSYIDRRVNNPCMTTITTKSHS